MKNLPKIFHFIWIGEDGPPEDRRNNPKKWASLNPDWDVWVWDEEKLLKMVRDKFPDCFAQYSSADMPVKQSDMARPMLMHLFGGAYIDYDLVPLLPIRSVFESGVVYNRCWEPLSRLPEQPAVERVNYDGYKVLFCKENQRIDSVGYGIGNNFMASVPGLPSWIHFLEQQKDCGKGIVLNFFGPWALTRFIRSKFRTHYHGPAATSRALAMPNHYFLYEPLRGSGYPSYCVSYHPAVNTWGDKSRDDWWKV